MRSGGTTRLNASADYTQAADDTLMQWHQRGNWYHISLFHVTIAGTVRLPSPFGRSRKNIAQKNISFHRQSRTLDSDELRGNFHIFYAAYLIASLVHNEHLFTPDHVVASCVLRANLLPAGDPWWWIT